MGGYLSLISSCPRRTSDVDFCTMDTAPDLQVERELVKEDREQGAGCRAASVEF